MNTDVTMPEEISKAVKPVPFVRHPIASARKTIHNEGSYYGDWPGRRTMHQYAVHFQDGKYPTAARGQTRDEAIEDAHRSRHSKESHDARVVDMGKNPHRYTKHQFVNTFQASGPGRVALGAQHGQYVATAVANGKRVPAAVLADYPELKTASRHTHKGVRVAILHPAALLKGASKPKDAKKKDTASSDATAPKKTVSSTVREASYANRHAVADACDHEDADKVMIAGKGGKKYPATHCWRCGRIKMDDAKHHSLADDRVPLPVLAKAVAAGLYKAHDVSDEQRDGDGKWTSSGINPDSPEFKEWFAGSQLTEANGQPKPYYHGTPNGDFDSFNNRKDRKGYSSYDKKSPPAHFFTPDIDRAKRYAKNGPKSRVHAVYLQAKNVFDFDNPAHIAAIAPAVRAADPKDAERVLRETAQGSWLDIERPFVIRAIKEAGFDAFQVYERTGNNVAVFTPEQIKVVTTLKNTESPLSKSVHYDKETLHRLQLRWITAHPNGEEPGVPLLVHDNGQQYTVVGGAGGRLNQQVFQKPKGDASGNERKAQMKEKRIAKQKAAREALGADAQELEDKKKALQEEAKRQTDELTNKVLGALGDQFAGNALEKVATEARKRALKEHAGATEGEQKEFADKASKEAVSEANEAARKVVQQALNAAAMRALGDDDGSTPTEFAAKISGQQLVKKFTPEQLDDFVTHAANIAAIKGKAKAIQRALATGDQDAVQGIQADVKPLSPEEAKAHNLANYLDGMSVDAHTALVTGSEAASTISQRRNQANGASDGLNSFAADQTGDAILRPEAVKTLGIENAARVAAAYLAHKGIDKASTAEGLRDRIGNESYANVKATLDVCDKMDERSRMAKEAAAEGDGSVTTAQASITAANMASQKMKLLNLCRGQNRVAAALAHHLEHPSQRSLSVPGGSTAISAHALAKGLGLKEGDYSVEKGKHGEGGGYKVTVEAGNLHKIATPHKVAESNRNVAMDDLRQDVEQNPGQWKADGFNYDGYDEKDGTHVNISLQPHHELAVRAIVDQKRMLCNYAAGSGKTSIIHAALAHLINNDKIDRGLVTMPAKPLAQQNDFTDEDTGEQKTGEITKFLSPEDRKRVVVLNGGNIDRTLKRVKAGEKLILMCTPETMGSRLKQFQDAGFGGERSAYFADEAHRLATGDGEGDGARMARAARELSGSEFFSPMSGTLVEHSGSELHDLLDMAHPGEYGDKKKFGEEWQRLAQGQGNFFSSEAMRGMRDRLSGSMVSFAKPVEGKSGEPLTQECKVHTVALHPAQKAALAKVNADYKKRRASDNPEIRKGASFWRKRQEDAIFNDGVMDPTTGQRVNPKVDAVAKIMDDEKARDPKNRALVYSFNTSTRAQVRSKLKQHKSVEVKGGQEAKDVANAISQFNDRTNDTSIMYISDAANYGVNAQGGDCLIKMHPLDTFSKETQLNARIFRKGQTRNTRAFTLVTNHPSEQNRQHRNETLKMPVTTLLATLADSTGAAGHLAKNMGAIKAAAAGN